MKKVFKYVGVIMILILFIFISLAIIHNTTHQTENVHTLRDAISTAMDKAYIVRDSYYYQPENDWDLTNTRKKMLAEFAKTLLSEISTESNINIKIVNVNSKKGTMDIVVTQSYKYPSSSDLGETTCHCTMIYEKKEPEAPEQNS